MAIRRNLNILRYGWRDALKAVEQGGRVIEYADGHAEVTERVNIHGAHGHFETDSYAFGYLTKHSLELLKAHQAASKK